MSSGDPQASWVQWPYPHYYGPAPMYPGYYHFQPQHNFCPCCGQRLNQQLSTYGQAIGATPPGAQTS